MNPAQLKRCKYYILADLFQYRKNSMAKVNWDSSRSMRAGCQTSANYGFADFFEEHIMKIRIIFAIAIFLAYAAEQSLAQDPELILDPISFDNRQLVISYTTNPQAQFTNCDLKIRTSDKQGPLSSPGLGKLLSNSTNVTSDQFYAGLSSIFTNSLTRKPKNGLAYFRVYLTCSDFVIQSNIESYDFSAIKIKKVKFNKWVRHVKSKIDQF